MVKISKNKLFLSVLAAVALVVACPSFTFFSHAATFDIDFHTKNASFATSYMLANQEYVREVSFPFTYTVSDSGVGMVSINISLRDCTFSDSNIVSWVDNAQLHLNGQIYSGSYVYIGNYVFQSEVSFEFAGVYMGSITADVHYIYSQSEQQITQENSTVVNGGSTFYNGSDVRVSDGAFVENQNVQTFSFTKNSLGEVTGGTLNKGVSPVHKFTFSFANPLSGIKISQNNTSVIHGKQAVGYNSPASCVLNLSILSSGFDFKPFATAGVTIGEQQITNAISQGNTLQQQSNQLQQDANALQSWNNQLQQNANDLQTQNNQLQTQTNGFLSNFEGSAAMSDSTAVLDTAVTDYDSLETDILNSSRHYFEQFDAAKPFDFTAGVTSAMVFLSSNLMALITGMSEFSLLYTIGIALVIFGALSAIWRFVR